jgi:hypothetical protein
MVLPKGIERCDALLRYYLYLFLGFIHFLDSILCQPPNIIYE